MEKQRPEDIYGEGESRIIGAVWVLPSREACSAMLAEIERKEKEWATGPHVKVCSVFSATSKTGHYIVLVGRGLMFSASYLTACGLCAKRQGGDVLSGELASQKQELINWAFREWRMALKREKKTVKGLIAQLRKKEALKR